jgi:DNA-directed RNA polymerase specialized sigma subunit
MERVDTWEVREERGPGQAEVAGPATRREAAEQWRARVDVLDLRANLLNRQDRALLQMHLEAGRNFHEIARWTGLSPATVCRRIHRMIHRLSDPTYTVCLRNQRHFSPVELDVIRDRFVRGLSLASIGRHHALGHRRIRRIVAKARQMARTLAAV